MSVNEEEIYAAHLYPPEAIPLLLQARDLMTQAHNVLDQLFEEGKIRQGDPAAEACDLLDQAINMLEPEPDEEGEPESGKIAKSETSRLVIDDTQPEAES